MGFKRYSPSQKRSILKEMNKVEDVLPGATAEQIAGQLNVSGLKTSAGLDWTANRVQQFRNRNFLRKRRNAKRTAPPYIVSDDAPIAKSGDRLDLALEVMGATSIPQDLRKKIARQLLAT